MIPLTHGIHDRRSGIFIPQSLDELHVIASSGIVFEKGDARAIRDEELGARPYYRFVQTWSRDFDVALRERIVEAIEHRLIGTPETGRFDDRKWRVASVDFPQGVPRVRLGPTHFLEYLDVDIKAAKDPALYRVISLAGEASYGDANAFFANPLGVNTVLVSEEGHVILTQRSSTAQLLPGYWHQTAGFVDADFGLMQRSDASAALYFSLVGAIKAELEQEMGILPTEVRRVQMTGLVYDPTSYDFTFATDIKLPMGEILERQKDAADRDPIIHVCKTVGELTDFLEKPIPFGGTVRGSLLLYIGLQDKDALRYLLQREALR